MKRGTIRHPKLLHLAHELALPPYAALGVLEALLDWTFDYAREGDVGRFDNAAIAAGVGWEGDPARLVDALVMTRWLDRCVTHRLVVHDLADHAPDSWKRLMTRQGRTFARPSPSKVPDYADTSPVNDGTMPTLVPSLTVPPAPAPAPAPTPLQTLGFAQFWLSYPKKRHKPDAERAWKHVHGDAALETIVAGVVRWKASDAWTRGFIEDPGRFLRQRQWEDDPHAAEPSANERAAEMLADLRASQKERR